MIWAVGRLALGVPVTSQLLLFGQPMAQVCDVAHGLSRSSVHAHLDSDLPHGARRSAYGLSVFAPDFPSIAT